MTINTIGLEGMKYFESSGLFAVALILLIVCLLFHLICLIYVHLRKRK